MISLYVYHLNFVSQCCKPKIYYIDRSEYDTALTEKLIAISKINPGISQKELEQKALESMRKVIDRALEKLPPDAVVLDGNSIIQGGKKVEIDW